MNFGPVKVQSILHASFQCKLIQPILHALFQCTPSFDELQLALQHRFAFISLQIKKYQDKKSNRLKRYRLSFYTTKTYCTFRGTKHSKILYFRSRKIKVSKWLCEEKIFRLMSLLILPGVDGCYHWDMSFWQIIHIFLLLATTCAARADERPKIIHPMIVYSRCPKPIRFSMAVN